MAIHPVLTFESDRLPNCYLPKFTFTLLLSVLVFCLRAENISVKPAPAWLYKPSLKPVKPYQDGSVGDGYYLEYVDVQVNLREQATFRHYIRHIVNETGVQNASEISVSYDPAYQKLVFHSVTLIRDGKKMNQLDLGQVRVVQEETDAESFQYNGSKRAFIVLKGTRKNDRVEFAYSIIGFNPVFKNHFSDKIYFSAEDEISNFFQTYLVPVERKLRINTFNGAPKPTETRQKDLVVYHWNNPPVKLYESQNQVPGWFNNYPYVEVSDFQGWKEVADWGYHLFNGYQFAIPEELKTRIAQWRALSKGDKEMFANLATRFVQDEVRYLGMESGIYSHTPHLPSDVYKQRYGDCKDKALLLTTILRQENIPAYVAFVSTERRSQLKYATPSVEDFDHAIVAVERSSGYLFIDATMNFQRGEFSTTYIPDYGYGLLLKEGADSLQPIEPGYPNTTDITERYVLPLKDSSRLFVTTVYKGGAADRTRADFAESSIKEINASYLRYYEKYLDGIRVRKNVAFSDDSVKNEFTTEEEYSIPLLWKDKEGGGKTIDVFAKSAYSRIPDPQGVYADGPMSIEFPLTVRYTLILDMDENYNLPFEEIHQKTGSYQFDFTYAVHGNQIEFTYFYKTFKDHIPQTEVAAYKEAYDKMAEYISFQFSTGGVSGNTPNKDNDQHPWVNWLMVLIAIGVLAGLIPIFRKLDRLKPAYEVASFANERIGGWVVVMGISLTLSLGLSLYGFYEGNYFDYSAWSLLGSSRGRFMQFVFVFELVYILVTSAFLVFLLYLYFNRRDIFPRIFSSYMIGFLASQILLMILYGIAQTTDPTFAFPQESISQFVKSLIYTVIWTSYLRKSERVRNTFVVPKQREWDK